jgi:copper chaperone CopZ
MRYWSILFSFMLLLLSCSTEPNVVHLKTVKGKNHSSQRKVSPNKLLTVGIEGMSCEMACGGSIRTNLRSTGAVARVQYDFEEGRDVQTAFISFNDEKISEEEILSIIETINEKQFKTHNHSTQEINSGENTPNSPADNGSSKVDVAEGNYRIPNLFHILSNIIH